jgi:hypothetical protein
MYISKNSASPEIHNVISYLILYWPTTIMYELKQVAWKTHESFNIACVIAKPRNLEQKI